MKNASLRLKIALMAVLVGGLGMLAFGAIMGQKLETSKLENLDELLVNQADDFFDAIQNRNVPMDWNHDDSIRELFHLVRSFYSTEIEQPPGVTVYRSRNLGMRPLPTAIDRKPVTATLDAGFARVYQEERNGLVIRVAADLDPTFATQRDLRNSFAIALPTILVLIALGALWLTRQALQPVEEIAKLADTITATRMGDRLPEPARKDEIGNLTVVLNRMMDRLQASFEQSRRFAADASHELKTPLTIIRGEVDAALRSGNLPPAIERTMVNLQEETGRLVHMVEGLLLLSQADAGRLKPTLKPVYLSELASDMQEDVEILAEPRNITLKLQIEPGIFVAGDKHLLTQVLLNLFDNAIKYNLEGGRIEALLESRGTSAVFRIGNVTGIDIRGSERQLVFERFYRAESSRDRARGGQGLGLSICEEILRAHGGGISLVDDSMPDWTTFEFHIPLVPSTT